MSSPKLTHGRHTQHGATYAVTVALLDRRPLFSSPALARIVGEQIHACDHEGASLTHAWVAMPDHIHWLFTLPNGTLSTCVCRFKSRSARAINQAQKTDGAVWQTGFYDHRLRDEEDLRLQARYIIANPIRAGLVADGRAYPHWECRWITNLNDL